MPVYSYRCDLCGNEFDALLFAGETDDVVSCPECGEKSVSRQISAFSQGGSCSSDGSFT